jgi:dTDP-4-amino-4,6-dideoxygalactose transaminase
MAALSGAIELSKLTRSLPIPVNSLGLHLEPVAAEILEAVRQVLSRGRFILGPEVEAFEECFAASAGVAHAAGVANGTDALALALRALDVQAGQRVVTVANAGGYATAAILAAGATPVLVDVDARTYTMQPAALAAALERPTAAVIVTHLYGRMADMPALLALADPCGVPVIEDCAQAHGARLDGRPAGSWGRLAAFSFYPTKNLGGIGDGGAVTTNDVSLDRAVRELRNYGWSERYRIARRGGCNSRLDEVQAAVLRVLLPHLQCWNQRRREIAALYSQRLQGTGLILPLAADDAHVCHLYVVRSPQRERLRRRLHELGVETAVHYPIADHEQPAYIGHTENTELALTQECCRTVLTLPCFPEMSDADVAHVGDAVGRACAEQDEAAQPRDGT